MRWSHSAPGRLTIALATCYAFVAVFVWWRAEFSAGPAVPAAAALLCYLVFAATSIALGLIDGSTSRLPNRIVYPGIAVVAGGILVATLATGDAGSALRALAAAASLFVFYAALWLSGGVGLGDVKLAALIGLALGWLGWPAVIVGTLIGFLLAGAFGLLLIAARLAGRKSRTPFGPWMLLGAWVGIFLSPAF